MRGVHDAHCFIAIRDKKDLFDGVIYDELIPYQIIINL